MKKQIVHISIHQTSKVISAMHAVMFTVLFLLPTAIAYMFQGDVGTGLGILVLLPFISWLIMYIGYVIACWFFNLVTPWTGGIEFDMVDKEQTAAISQPMNPEKMDHS